MRFYKKQHRFYCGIDLHVRTMYLCIIDQEGKILLHKNLPSDRQAFLEAIEPFRGDIVIGCECTYSWYWLADLCANKGLAFILGHALYMKAIHGGKVKNDRVDSEKIACLIRAGMFPMAYVYPMDMRPTRDLLRRRMRFVRQRGDLLRHLHIINAQQNLPDFEGAITHRANRQHIEDRYPEPSIKKSVVIDTSAVDHLDGVINDIETFITRTAKRHDPQVYWQLQTVPGIGRILSLVILYEIHRIDRFPRVQDFLSYARLVKPAKESAGKRVGRGPAKIGNPYLKWAFNEAALLFIRGNPPAKAHFDAMALRHGKSKAIAIMACKLGRAVYFMLTRGKAFDQDYFLRAA